MRRFFATPDEATVVNAPSPVAAAVASSDAADVVPSGGFTGPAASEPLQLALV